MTSMKQESTKQITNEITALFMGELDSKTGKWFPIKKMTWSKRRNQNYLNCSIKFIQGASNYQALYPERKNLFIPRDITRVMKYQDVEDCAWSDRMPVARPLEVELKKCMGLDLNSFVDPIKFVARDGGYQDGDLCGLFPEIAPDEQGNYNFMFRGIDVWVMCSDNKPELEAIPVGAKVTLQPQDKLEIVSGEWKKPMVEPPPETIRMKMFVGKSMVGYAPPYIKDLYRQFGQGLKVEVYQVNHRVPFEYQFLFLAAVNQDEGLPFSQLKYQPLNFV